MAKKQKYYVIWAGHKTGIFDTWTETEQNIKGFPNAQFKSFETKEQAFHASKKNYWASIQTKSPVGVSPRGLKKYIEIDEQKDHFSLALFQICPSLLWDK